MPASRGLSPSTTARVKALPSCRATRLFAVTGYGLDSDRSRSRDAGFEGHFVKPVALSMICKIAEADASPI